MALRPAPFDTHKGDYGHLSFWRIGRQDRGSGHGCEAALRMGAGWSPWEFPRVSIRSWKAKLTEVMTEPLRKHRRQTLSLRPSKPILRLCENKEGLS